eukprot:gene8170-9604_t
MEKSNDALTIGQLVNKSSVERVVLPEYPVIDRDPSYSMVTANFRPKDYLQSLAIPTIMTSAYYLSTRRHAVTTAVWAAISFPTIYYITYENVNQRLKGFSENKQECEKYNVQYPRISDFKQVEDSDGGQSILLVEASGSSHTAKAIDISSIEEWCIENAIEFMMLDKDQHMKYEQKESDDGDQRIKYGIDRLKEFLETIMWTNMNYKTASRPAELDENGDDVEDNEDNEETKVEVEKTTEKDNTKQQISDSLKLIESMLGMKVSDSGEDGEQTTEGGKDQVDKEFDMMNAFDNTFKEMKTIRDQLKNLNDDDRRDMAAKVAMMFMRNMGVSEEDEGGDLE